MAWKEINQPTNLCLNMRAGSMLAEVNRTTCRISLAIIRSFSKFTRPSTLESLPDERTPDGEYEVGCHNYKADKWFMFCYTSESSLQSEDPLSQIKVMSLFTWATEGHWEFLETCTIRETSNSYHGLICTSKKALKSSGFLAAIDLRQSDSLKRPGSRS